MIKRAVLATMLLTGCRYIEAERGEPFPATSIDVDAGPEVFTITLAGWTADTTVIVGVGGYPPFQMTPINSTATISVVNLNDPCYGWTVLMSTGEERSGTAC